MTYEVVPLQVCVSECPDENEVGVRNNPVCVDEVDPNKYQNVTDVSFSNAALIKVCCGISHCCSSVVCWTWEL